MGNLAGTLEDRSYQSFDLDADNEVARRVKLDSTTGGKLTRAFSTGSNSRPTVNTASSTILAANNNRRYAYIFNQSGAVIYLKLGAAAVVGEGIRLANDTIFEITIDKLWTGTVQAIRNAGTGAVDVFEGTL